MSRTWNPAQFSRELTPSADALPAFRKPKLFEPGMIMPAIKQSFVMLRPDIQWKNPVMFVVEVGAFLTLAYLIRALFGQSESQVSIGYFVALDIWLFLTVLFANFATAIAEARGRAHAESLRRARHDTVAHRIIANGKIEDVSSSDLVPGDIVIVKTGDFVPGDGEIIKGAASIDESAITGESAPVIRESGGDRSGVTGGTRVVSDEIHVKIVSGAGESFLDRMIALVEGAIRQRTPNEIALTLVLSAFSLIFLIVVIPLWPIALNAEQYMTGYLGLPDPLKSLGTDVPTLIALLVCLIPTTIGALLAAVGIAGMDRALRANVMAKSGKAVETAGDIDVVLLDKTGTITVGNRHATAFLPVGKCTVAELGRLALFASAADETPEGKTIVEKAKEFAGSERAGILGVPIGAEFIPFSAHTRMSGVDLPDGHKIRKGAFDAIIEMVKQQGGKIPVELDEAVKRVAAEGATPLVVAQDNQIAGVVVLEDVLKPAMTERFDRLRRMGLRTVMITGDNPLTAGTMPRRQAWMISSRR
jgi:K+-transporting ATPase ATPase B chain